MTDELQPDPNNANRGTKRGRDLLEKSFEQYGAGRSALASADGVVLAGNKSMEVAIEKGLPIRIVETNGKEYVVLKRTDLSYDDPRARELAIADNRVGQVDLDWDPEMLKALKDDGVKLEGFFFDEELSKIMGADKVPEEAKAVPDKRATDIKPGDVFSLGEHFLACGDTRDAELLGLFPKGLTMLHADPPYGMGKEKDGIANDNLRGEKLDGFQAQWIAAWLPLLAENGSVYIWGNAPDLWRLWWTKRELFEGFLARTEIVWDKGTGLRMSQESAHAFACATERCLFLMRGQQFLGNQNKDEYWEGYEPLRSWLEEQRNKAGWKNADVNKLTETQMAGHWFSKSQFVAITQKHYETLRTAAEGRAFVETYDELVEMLDRTGGNEYRRELSAKMREARTYFDNTHEAMTDVWTFGRVTGEERFGHATPKPVDMVVRAMKSSTEKGDIIGVPFAGTCPEIIAAEMLGRRVVAVELAPEYCQIVIDRWEAYSKKKAEKL